jgi:serine/threonine protein kinase
MLLLFAARRLSRIAFSKKYAQKRHWRGTTDHLCVRMVQKQRSKPMHARLQEFLTSVGTLFARFDTQDSGNRSYGVQIDGERYFIKTAGDPSDPLPVLSYAERVALLYNAARLHSTVQHPICIPLLHLIESPEGPLLVYPWRDGELIGGFSGKRDDPDSAFQRFRRLPASTITAHLTQIFELHAALGEQGWVAVDFYDGCLLYDFDRDLLHVMDLDLYHLGPFTNTMGRMFGSSRFMAPEEFTQGALIDQRTNVFTMGRAALIFLGDGSSHRAPFRGSLALYAVAVQASVTQPEERYPSLAAFYEAWCAALE